jgi:Flp pilus assembly protein TadG
MSKSFGRKKRIIVTTAAMLAIGGGAAFAYWAAAGTSNTTTTAAAAAANYTVTSSVAGTALSPGSEAQTVTFIVKNESTGGQKLANVAVTVAGTDGTSWTGTG